MMSDATVLRQGRYVPADGRVISRLLHRAGLIRATIGDGFSVRQNLVEFRVRYAHPNREQALPRLLIRADAALIETGCLVVKRQHPHTHLECLEHERELANQPPAVVRRIHREMHRDRECGHTHDRNGEGQP